MGLKPTEGPQGFDEFELARVTPVESAAVRLPGVAESPIHLARRAAEFVDLGTEPSAGSVVIGRIVNFHADEPVLFGGTKVDLSRLRPIGRLAGAGCCRPTDLFDMPRPPFCLSEGEMRFEGQL